MLTFLSSDLNLHDRQVLATACSHNFTGYCTMAKSEKKNAKNCRVWDWTVLQDNKLECHSARDVETPRWVRNGQPKGTSKTGVCVCVCIHISQDKLSFKQIKKTALYKVQLPYGNSQTNRIALFGVLRNICVYVRQKQRERIFWTVVSINDIICLLLCCLHCLIFPQWTPITIPDSH